MKSILVINGNEEHLTSISSVLMKSGFSVTAESDGAAGLGVIAKGTGIDAVVVHYILPDMDGREFLTSFKRTTRSSRIPVIFIHDRIDMNHYLSGLSLGAFDFLFEPVHTGDLLRLVRAAVRERSAVVIEEGLDVEIQKSGQPKSDPVSFVEQNSH